MTWYKTGTVSVTSGSNAVIGAGTSFIANSRVGDAFRGPDGEWYEVTNIASDTALSIAPNYQGPTQAAGVYSLAPMQGYVKDSADALRAATQVIASGVADMQEQVAVATEAAVSAGQSKTAATEQAGIASSAAQTSTENKDAAQQAAQQSGTSAQASGTAADRAEAAKTSIIQSEQAAAASATAAAESAAHAEEVTLGKAASGANSDITSLSGLTTALSVDQGGTGSASAGDARTALGIADGWAVQPIGVPIAVMDNLAGVSAPPVDRGYRYIKLTASDSYNSGALTSESVTGSAPLVLATGVLSLVGSPLNERTISLINTERRVLRAGSAGVLEMDAFQSHRHALFSMVSGSNTGGGVNGVAYPGSLTGYSGSPLDDGSGGASRTASETRAKSIGVTFYMRVK